MKTKDEAWILIHKQLSNDTPVADNKSHFHYGKLELVELLDFIYSEDEEVKSK